jgi:hypothetical protein
MRLITGLPFRDTQCGFKLFEARAYGHFPAYWEHWFVGQAGLGPTVRPS